MDGFLPLTSNWLEGEQRLQWQKLRQGPRTSQQVWTLKISWALFGRQISLPFPQAMLRTFKSLNSLDLVISVASRTGTAWNVSHAFVWNSGCAKSELITNWFLMTRPDLAIRGGRRYCSRCNDIWRGWPEVPRPLHLRRSTRGRVKLRGWRYHHSSLQGKPTRFGTWHLEGILKGSPLRNCLFTNFQCETVSYGVI